LDTGQRLQGIEATSDGCAWVVSQCDYKIAQCWEAVEVLKEHCLHKALARERFSYCEIG
jgi:hypothetical protein